MAYAIETNLLCKQYGEKSCVDHLSLQVEQGTVYGFMGPNGAGKSTTMKMLLGLTKPTSGTVALLHTEMNDKNRLDLLRQTGSLVESPSYYGHLTAQENLEIISILKEVDKKQIAQVLEIVQLTSEKDKKVKQYSLGMKQRLGIAAALLGTPKLLLLDEPTNGLDPAGIQEIRALICRLPQQYDITVLVSSHLLSELDQMATQVGIIDRGKLLFQGSLQALHAHSTASISLRTLQPDLTCQILKTCEIAVTQEGSELLLPAMPDEALAGCITALAQQGVGVVRIGERAKTLEEIFLGLTGNRGNTQ